MILELSMSLPVNIFCLSGGKRNIPVVKLCHFLAPNQVYQEMDWAVSPEIALNGC
jgi:hypothetical protein